MSPSRFTGVVEERAGCRGRSHDSAAAYKVGCRCPKAREAKRLYYKRCKEHRQPPASVSSVGTLRRLAALNALGWRLQDVASVLGVSLQALGHLRDRDRLYRSTANRVTAAYDQLSMREGPSSLARVRAARQGFFPPLAWEGLDIDDPAAVPSIGVAWSTERGVSQCS